MLKSTAKDTQVSTRITKIDALANPELNIAGIAINNENNGIKIQVRFRKNPKFILEINTSSRHNA